MSYSIELSTEQYIYRLVPLRLTIRMEEYNITRSLTILLQPRGIGSPYDNIWRHPISGQVPDEMGVARTLSRTFARNGFMPFRGKPLDNGYRVMGRRVEPRDHPAAPTDMSITPPNPPGAYKVIQKLEDWGYNVFDDDSDDELNQILVQVTYADVESQYQAIRITVPSVSREVIDEFIYFDIGTTAGNTLAITQAWNFRRDDRPQHEKLALRDIILGFWVFNLGRAAHDLSAIMYYSVIETVLKDELFQLVYQMMDEDILTHLVLNRETESPQEKEVFDLLLKRAPFCIGVNRMLEEYQEFAEVHIKSFEFLPFDTEDPAQADNPPFQFRINFQ